MNKIEQALAELEDARECIESGEGQVLSPLLLNIRAHLARAQALLAGANHCYKVVSDLTSWMGD
jgi:hypothetical protein